MVASAVAPQRAQFALRLEQGKGRLVLAQRKLTSEIELEELSISLREVPQRLNLTAGVERFRNTWGRLDSLTVSLSDLVLTRFLRQQLKDRPLTDIEVRVSGGDIFVVGELVGEHNAPFLIRFRIEPAGGFERQTLLFSAYSAQVYAPHRVNAPVIAGWILDVFEPYGQRHGATLVSVNFLSAIMGLVFSELGWKIPSYRKASVTHVSVEAGRIQLQLAQNDEAKNRQHLVSQGRASNAQFLTDFESKRMFEDVENALWVGEDERVLSQYERQLELNPKHPFLIRRLLQLHASRPSSRSEMRLLSGILEAQNGASVESEVGFAIAALEEDRPKLAIQHYQNAIRCAEGWHQGLEISQLQCALATVLVQVAPDDAIDALQSALGYRRRLPGALRRLSALYVDQGLWSDAIATTERLLIDEIDETEKLKTLLALGQLAIERGTGAQALDFYGRAQILSPDNAEISLGLGRAYLAEEQTLSALRTLDQAARLFQESGHFERAAETLIEIGDIWCQQDGGHASAMMRYRQALSIQPGFSKALKALAEIAERNQDWAVARQTYDELLRASENGQADIDRFAAMLLFGQFLLKREDTFAEGVGYLQRCLDGPQSTAKIAMVSLTDVFERAERWTDLVRHLDRSIEHDPSIDRLALRMKQAHIVDTYLNDPERALSLLTESDLQVSQEKLEYQVELQRRLNRFEALERSLFDLAQRLGDPERLSALHTERGDLLRFELNRSQESAVAYGHAVACMPKCIGALKGLVDVYREQERYGELVETLGQLAPLIEGIQQTDLLVEQAKIARDMLGRLPQALEVLEGLTAEGEDEAFVLSELATTYLALNHRSKALETYESLARVYDLEGYDEDPSEFKFKLGQLHEEEGSQREALKWYRAALEHNRNALPVYESIQDNLLVSEGLEGTVNFLLSALQERVKPKTDEFLRLRAGRLLWRQQGNAEQAFEVLRPLSQQESVDGDVLTLMLEMTTALGNWAEVSRLLEQRLYTAKQSERPSILMNLAVLSARELSNPAQAAQFAEAALKEDPTYVPAVVLLSEIAFAAHNWIEVDQLIERLGDIDGYSLTAEDLFRRAVAALHRGVPGRAISSLRIIDMMGAYFPGMWSAFVEGYLQIEDYAVLPPFVDKMLTHELDDEGTASLLQRCVNADGLILSPLALSEVNKRGLTPTVENNQNVSPLADTKALDEHLVSEVEASFEVAAFGSYEPETRTERMGSWSNKISTENPVFDQTALTPKTSNDDVGNVSETEPPASIDDGVVSVRSDGDEALPITVEAVTTIPTPAESDLSDDDAFLSFVREMPSQASLEAPDEEAQKITTQIESAQTDAERGELWFKLGELKRDRLFDPQSALDAFWAVVELVLPQSDLWMESIEALEDIYSVEQDWDSMVRLLDLRAEKGGEDITELALIKAATLRNAKRVNEAIDAAIVALPIGERAVELLVELLTSVGRNVEAATYMQDAAETYGGLMGDHYRLRAAELFKVDDPDAAFELLESLSFDECIELSLDDQIELAERLERFDRLPDLLLRKAESLPEDPAQKIKASRLLMRAAEVAESQNYAAELYQRAVDFWPENIDAVTAMRRIYEALNDTPGVVESFEREISLALPGQYRGALKLSLAELLHEEMKSPEQARGLITQALDELTDESVKLKAHALLSKLDGDTVDILSSVEVVESLSKTAAFVRENESDETRIERLENALGLDPNHEAAYEELADLYRSARRFDELSTVLERHTMVSTTDEQRAALLLDRASVAEDFLGDSALARRLWERVIDLPEVALDALRFSMISVLSTNPRRVDLERLVERLNRHIEEANGERRAGMLSLRAELWHRHLGETNRAREDLEAALAVDEYNTVALFALARIALGRGELTDASAWIRDALHAPSVPGQLSVVESVLVTLRQGFNRQDRDDEWDTYLDSLLSEHTENIDLTTLLVGLQRVNEPGL